MPTEQKHKMGWANRVTMGRLLLIGPFVVCLLNLDDPDREWMRWASIAIFVVMALSDLVDGWLARLLHDESPLGAFLDPLADKLLVTAAVIILCVVGIHEPAAAGGRTFRLPNWVVVTAIGKDLIVSLGFVVVYLSTGTVFIRPSRLGKWCTGLQLIMVLSVLVWLDLPAWLSEAPRGLWIVSSLLAVFAAIDYIRMGHRYIAEAAHRPDGSDAKNDRSS